MSQSIRSAACRCRSARDLQNACNLRAVARELVRLSDEAFFECLNTDKVKQDPAVIMTVAKLADMVGLSYEYPRAAEEAAQTIIDADGDSHG